GILLLDAAGRSRGLVPVAPLPSFLNLSEWFASSVASVGDLDGDGIVDLAVGAPLFALGPNVPSYGAVYLTFLNPDGSPRTLARITRNAGGFTGSLGDYANFGSSVLGAGDLDGDGTGDLIVGAPGDDAQQGSVWAVYLDPKKLVKGQRKLSVPGSRGFGSSILQLDDLDGDGVRDLAVGALGSPAGGSVWILHMNADQTIKATRELPGSALLPTGSSGFGASLALIDDTDGDGRRELAVGVSGYLVGNYEPGAVLILSLNADGSVASQHTITTQSGGFPSVLSHLGGFGYGLACPGDLDGDGHRDLVAAAQDRNAGSTGVGDILEAVYAASDGDLLMVEPGTYDDPVVEGKALSLVARDPDQTRLTQPLEVRNTPADGRVLIRGVRAEGLVLEDNPGLVWIEDLDAGGSLRKSRIVNSARVVLQHVSLESSGSHDGQPELDVSGSSVSLFDCWIRGLSGGLPGPGSPAVSAVSSFLYVAGGSLLGGDGWIGNCAPGGAALSIDGDAVLFDATLRAGANPCTGTVAPAIARAPGASVRRVQGHFLSVATPAVLNPGDPFTISVRGPRATPVWVGIASTPTAFHLSASGLTSLLRQPVQISFLGTTDSNGTLVGTLPMPPLPPGFEFQTTVLQAIALELPRGGSPTGGKAGVVGTPRWILGAGSQTQALGD
ncbi:MAG TPA: hypothetical protein ENJ09_09835, partial [Planctomycetes bacterium]|nr:hypothetical protein [Planctomycetota bacterium]